MGKFITLTANYDLPDREHTEIIINIKDIISVKSVINREEQREIGCIVTRKTINKKGKTVEDLLPVKQNIDLIKQLLSLPGIPQKFIKVHATLGETIINSSIIRGVQLLKKPRYEKSIIYTTEIDYKGKTYSCEYYVTESFEEIEQMLCK